MTVVLAGIVTCMAGPMYEVRISSRPGSVTERESASSDTGRERTIAWAAPGGTVTVVLPEPASITVRPGSGAGGGGGAAGRVETVTGPETGEAPLPLSAATPNS